jgi:hypothetical protein
MQTRRKRSRVAHGSARRSSSSRSGGNADAEEPRAGCTRGSARAARARALALADRAKPFMTRFENASEENRHLETFFQNFGMFGLEKKTEALF